MPKKCRKGGGDHPDARRGANSDAHRGVGRVIHLLGVPLPQMTCVCVSVVGTWSTVSMHLYIHMHHCQKDIHTHRREKAFWLRLVPTGKFRLLDALDSVCPR